MKNCSVDEFKMHLDLILAKVPDEPKAFGSEYTPSTCDLFSGNPSNSIIDQIRGVSFPAVNRNPGNEIYKRGLEIPHSELLCFDK